jgi:hypothetical protein
MATSSPLTDPPDSTGRTIQASTLRLPKDIPHEVVQNIQSYYEEDLNAQGFDFLHALAANSASQTEVLVPPISHLAFAATVCVHPNTTTRTADPTKLAQSAAAFRLLRLLQRMVAYQIPWRQAFHFRKYDFFHQKVNEDIYTQFDSKHKYVANGLFTRAEDFWTIVGWAFNCACLPDMHAARWAYYEPFLSLMLDILDADFYHRAKEDTLDDSLLWSYIELASGSHGRSRRIIRAIFADGTTKCLNEFREIFSKELDPPKKAEEKPDTKFDLDAEQIDLAAYDLSSGDVSEDEARPQKRVRTRTRTPSARTSTESLREDYIASHSATLGPPAALRLRARFIRLLAEVVNYPSLTAHSPSTFVDRDELYTLFVEFIKPLPLSLFQEFILPNTHTGSALDISTHTRLCEAILQRALESRAPATPEGGLLDAARLIQCYLPYGASGSGVEAQARVALLIEALTRRAQQLNADVESLAWATEEGVKRREDYAREAMNSRKKPKHGEDAALKTLNESGSRLRAFVQNIK